MKIILGVCGGVAAYKAAELTRELGRLGAEVQVVMTAGAERFVTPLTFAALSGRQVLTSLWQPATSEHAGTTPLPFDIEHIAAGQQADAIVIAPATANFIATLAHGFSDDLLSALCLAATAPILLAPAMNVNMWHHPATQQNIATLKSRGIHIIAPASGDLACGMVGEGRLADITEIATQTFAAASPLRDLAKETILITAGGTREPIDPVRFLGNRSSGKMGLALAQAAHARGARVILVTAAPLTPQPFQQLPVTTAADMQAAVLAHLPQASVVVMAAAVADYRAATPAPHKLKKADTLTLNLVRNQDILAHIIQRRTPGTLVIGFAAETENLLEEGRRKLVSKHLDALFANDVAHPDTTFGSDQNAGTLMWLTHAVHLKLATKLHVANLIFDHLPAIRAAAKPLTNPVP